MPIVILIFAGLVIYWSIRDHYSRPKTMPGSPPAVPLAVERRHGDRRQATRTGTWAMP